MSISFKEDRIRELFDNDKQFRQALSSPEQIAKLSSPGLRLPQVVETAMEIFADRPAFGQRKKQLAVDNETGQTVATILPEFETITYAQLSLRYHNVANSWFSSLSLPWNPGDFIAFLGFTSTDYVSLDLAAIHIGAVSVPIQTSSTVKQITPILEETKPRIFAVGIEYFSVAFEALKGIESIERVVVFDYDARIDADHEKFESISESLANIRPDIVVRTYEQEVAEGNNLPDAPIYLAAPAENPLVTVIYTSGSTGTPKGAMYPEHILLLTWQSNNWALETTIPAILLHYMPLSHIFGRAWLIAGLKSGGTGYFSTKSDMSTLFEDLSLVRPTLLNLVPRVCDMVFHHYQKELDKYLDGNDPSEDIVKAVKEDIRKNFFGGRILFALCGSAPLDKEMKNFIESCLDIPVNDGYGATEIGGAVLVNNEIQKQNVLDYKLVDVPELGYFSTDKPYPRGELYIKTLTTIPGYYNRPDITSAVFTEEGLYKTGDIMAEIEPGKLIYLDRSNNVIKLSQGEFVPIAQIEAAFSNSPFIRQIYIYGDSSQPFLLAVIVPNYSALEQEGVAGEDSKVSIIDSLRKIAHTMELNSYEIPRDFIIEPEPFTQENGLLSGIGKLLRPNLKAKYYDQLLSLYQQINDQQLDKISELVAQRGTISTVEMVAQAALIVLGSSLLNVDYSTQFTDLGGDSLSAFTFATLLEQIFSVNIPVQVIISPTANIASIGAYINKELNQGSDRLSFDGVHGKGSNIVYAHDLTLAKFIDSRTLSAAGNLPKPNGKIRTVLLTGANGWLGHFLCLRWLEELAPSNGKVICVARGVDSISARERIAEAFDTGDTKLKKHFESLSSNLEVLAGDISEYHLGLEEDMWVRLVTEVDHIVHIAAFVNHVLPYSQLFGPNTLGTAELIRLAITEKIKPLNYISTVAVLALSEHGFSEDQDIRQAVPKAQLDDSYANGYAVSKWSGEVLLREVHEHFGVPVAVFRCDMILAHSKYKGQLNIADMFTRTILSILATGIAPVSFYQADSSGDRSHAHYDGLPADFVAEAIAVLGKNCIEGFQTYNVLNSNDDGISLDTFVDWLIQAGHSITRIDDYDKWYHRFELAMIGLPEKIKQYSVLPLLHAYEDQQIIHPGNVLPAQRFRSAVQEARIGPDKDIPHIDHQLIEKYADDIRDLSLL